MLVTFLLPPLIEPTVSIRSNRLVAVASRIGAANCSERVVARTGTSIPPERMFLMKASEKSNGLNAYVTGLGASKRIVVWDTTADRMPMDEILFTFAHESGHYVLNHIPKGLALARDRQSLRSSGPSARLAAGCWCSDSAIAWRISSMADLARTGRAAAGFGCAADRHRAGRQRRSAATSEHEADVYGQEAMHGLVADPQKTAVAAFNELGEAYLDDPNPNPFIEFWTYDHPSIQSRAIFAAQYDPWAPRATRRSFSREIMSQAYTGSGYELPLLQDRRRKHPLRRASTRMSNASPSPTSIHRRPCIC